MTPLAAGICFGLLAYHGWIFWAIFGIIVLIESMALCSSVAEEALGAATVLLIVGLATIHIGGVVDVVNLLRYDYLKVLKYVGIYIAIGLLIYAPIAGWLTAYFNRKKFTQALRGKKEEWLQCKRAVYRENHSLHVLSEADEAEILAAAEPEWVNGVKAAMWNEIISVEKDKNRIMRWTFFWPFHLLWHGLFRWVMHIEDVFDIIWARISKLAQIIKSSALRGADKDV